MEDLRTSMRIEYGVEERALLRLAWPGAQVHRTQMDSLDNKEGADYWVVIGHTRKGIDFKRRFKGAMQYWANPLTPEFPLEIENVTRHKPGWAVERKPLTDYLAFCFDDVPGLCYLLDARELTQAVQDYLPLWRSRYGTTLVPSKDHESGHTWQTEVMFTPVDTVLASLPEGSYFIPSLTTPEGEGKSFALVRSMAVQPRKL